MSIVFIYMLSTTIVAIWMILSDHYAKIYPRRMANYFHFIADRGIRRCNANDYLGNFTLPNDSRADLLPAKWLYNNHEKDFKAFSMRPTWVSVRLLSDEVVDYCCRHKYTCDITYSKLSTWLKWDEE